MLCEECQKRTACVHITKVNNSQKTEKHLCEYCAQKAGEFHFSSDDGLSVQDLLKGMFTQGYVETLQKATIVCPNCGMSYNDFSHNGKIGCSVCYSAFADRLGRMMRRIHGANAHTGKVPRRTGGALVARQNLNKLKRQLATCISNEEYEKAATLRDEIRQIEKEFAKRDGGDDHVNSR